jgi:hypothetical protein
MFKYHRPVMHRRDRIVATLILGVFLAVPTGAAAQSSEGGYNQPGGVVQQQLQPQPAQTEGREGSSDQAGALPFTGLDLLLVVTVGGVLVLSGFGIRRLLHPTETA